ncbi:MAG: pyridoxamine 5'-phosphate oxidase family protein, partial [Gemmatimonadales bacterium]
STARFVGLLAIDPATRRRMRAYGRLAWSPGEPMVIRLDQVYSNCPRYIQARVVEEAAAPGTPRPAGRSAALTDAQRAWIRRADTFFIATLNPEEGADASHRGGRPGFIQVEGNRLVWPDYAGNMMYNTLGNIAVHPRAGLAVPDFDSGGILQLTGRAAIDWDPSPAAAAAGAERLVELVVEEVIEIAGVLRPG